MFFGTNEGQSCSSNRAALQGGPPQGSVAGHVLGVREAEWPERDCTTGTGGYVFDFLGELRTSDSHVRAISIMWCVGDILHCQTCQVLAMRECCDMRGATTEPRVPITTSRTCQTQSCCFRVLMSIIKSTEINVSVFGGNMMSCEAHVCLYEASAKQGHRDCRQFWALFLRNIRLRTSIKKGSFLAFLHTKRLAWSF